MKTQFAGLDFRKFSRLRSIDMSIGLFDVLNLCLLLAGLFMANSRFILSPGVPLDLPIVTDVQSAETVGNLTVQSEKLIILDGKIFSLNTLEGGIRNFLKKYEVDGLKNKSFLVRGDRSIDMSTMLKIYEILQRVGFGNVQMAVQGQ